MEYTVLTYPGTLCGPAPPGMHISKMVFLSGSLQVLVVFEHPQINNPADFKLCLQKQYPNIW